MSATMIRLLLALSLALAAFAHRPAAFSAASVELSAYVLPDGSMPDLCATPGSDGESGAACEFCRLAAAVILPEPPCEPAARLALPAGIVNPFADAAAPRPALSPGAPPRGPPSRA